MLFPSREVECLVARIEALPPDGPLRVAVDGIDGAGKTTLADEVAAVLEGRGRSVIRASVDGFHRPREERYRRRHESAAGYYHDSFDYRALRSELLDPLGPGGDRRYRTAVFDYVRDRAVTGPSAMAAPDAVLLLDGVFLHRPELEGCFELTVYLDVPTDEALRRALGRDASDQGEALRARYRRRYLPGQRLYLAAVRPAERADVVVRA